MLPSFQRIKKVLILNRIRTSNLELSGAYGTPQYLFYKLLVINTLVVIKKYAMYYYGTLDYSIFSQILYKYIIKNLYLCAI